MAVGLNILSSYRMQGQIGRNLMEVVRLLASHDECFKNEKDKYLLL